MTTDGTPWLLTVALGCAGWFVTHVVDRVTNAPTLEYVVTRQAAPAGDTVQVELTNLTRDHVFDAVEVALQGGAGSKMSEPKITPVQPADEGPTPPTSGPATATFLIARMQPGSVYRLTVRYATAQSLDVSALPSIRVSSEASVVRPTVASWETSFARHEFLYLMVLGFGGVVGLAAWGKLSKPKDLGDNPAPSADAKPRPLSKRAPANAGKQEAANQGAK